MQPKSSLVFSIIICLAIRIAIVQGLQCYVCDDCNEYEDFKELEICEMGVIKTTQRPSTIIATEAVVTNTVTMINGNVTTLKPPVLNATESNNVMGQLSNNQPEGNKNVTAIPIATPTIPATFNVQNTNAVGPTNQPAIGITTAVNGIIENTTLAPNTITTLRPAQQPADYDYMEYEDPKIVNVNPLLRADTTTYLSTLNTVEHSVNYDYLEYDEPKIQENKTQLRAADIDSLMSINHPVCYMYRYHANNTIFTKRGCTTSINDNSYLTCQSLYNGHPISGCRICNTDGCNKFSDDESGEDHIYSTGVRKHLSLIVISLLTVVNIIGV